MCQGRASLSCNQTEVGSIPTVSTEWKVAGYGWPGRGANAVSPRGMRVRLPHLPLNALVVKRKSSLASNEVFRVRILAGVLVGEVPWSSGQGASPTRRRSVVRFHPGLLVDGVCGVRACIRGCEPRGAGFESRQTHGFQGCAPGRASCLQNSRTGFKSLRPCW